MYRERHVTWSIRLSFVIRLWKSLLTSDKLPLIVSKSRYERIVAAMSALMGLLGVGALSGAKGLGLGDCWAKNSLINSALTRSSF